MPTRHEILQSRALTHPTVHLNGTSQSELERELTDVMHAASTLREKLNALTVHPRDYYVKPQAGTDIWSADLNRVRDMASQADTIMHAAYAAIELLSSKEN